MNARFAVAAAAAALLLTACAPRAGNAARQDSWAGTITTEGNVTTVINESGSVWGGTAGLVEEASIGVETGGDAYMLGTIRSLAARDGRIYALDSSVPTVRVYDLAGTHVADIGRGGYGPGELGRAREGGPTAIAFDDAGRLYVKASNKIEIFSAAGEPVETWTMDRPHGGWGDFGMAITGEPAVIVADNVRCPVSRPWGCGTLFLGVSGDGAPEQRGRLPDLGYQPPRVEYEFDHGHGPEFSGLTPAFMPEVVWTVDRQGGLVAGRADRYEIHRYAAPGTADAEPRMVLSKYWDPVPVQDDEHDWHLMRNRAQSSFESVTSVGGYDLDDGLPRHKPAFQRFVAGADGSIWVVRQGPGERRPGCPSSTSDQRELIMNPCWHDLPIFDVFGADGRFLGAAEAPHDLAVARSLAAMFRTSPFVDGQMLLAVVEDEAGTIMVKRYRVVLPGAHED